MKDEGEMAPDRVGGGFEGQRKGRANSGFFCSRGSLTPVAAPNVSLHLYWRPPHFSGMAVD